MKKCAFISRHTPTAEQVALAARAGYELVHVGDCNAFDRGAVCEKSRGYEAVAVVHVSAALNFIACRPTSSVLVFENAQRTPEGGKPTFVMVGLHVYRVSGDNCCNVYVDEQHFTV